MKSIGILYDGNDSIIRLIEEKKLKPDVPYFIQIVTASEECKQAVKIAKFVQSKFPNATIMGFSSNGLICQGEQYTQGCLIVFRAFEKTKVFQSCFTWDSKNPAEVAAEVADAIADKPARLMHVVCGDYYPDMHSFVQEFNKRNDHTAMVGGLAGGFHSETGTGFVFTSEGVVKNGIIIAALCGGEFNYYTGVNTAHEPISGKHTLTKEENGVWKEVNGQDTREWLFEQLGLEKLESHTDWDITCGNDMLVHFPMILENFQSSSRFLRYDEKRDGIMLYYSKIPQGEEFRIGYVNPTECLQESFRLCNEVMNHPIEDLFSYTCLFRRLYLRNCSDWEIHAYKNTGLCGAFMMGEIAHVNGRNEMLNGSFVLAGVAENESYIRPNIHVFNELTAIGDDTTNLLNMVLKRQQKATTKQNEQLMETLLSQQEKQENQIFVDFNYGIPNYLKYKEDLKTKRYDKLCVMKTANAELLITHLGHTAFLKLMRNVVDYGKSLIEDLRENEHSILELYTFNESTFFVAADERMSQSHFLRICEKVHKDNTFLHMENGEVVVTRFVVCLDQKDPIEMALNALAANKNNQNSFLVCDSDDNETSSSEEFKMIGVLNRAFEENGVVPYFQGIYNNKTKIIRYYEALMRIKDVDGTIYAPGQFIGIAKKYHMYSSLSQKMIAKVFDLFSERDAKISINISAFDVQSEPTRLMIYNRLAFCKFPHNFVFEILEDEAYQDFGPLKEFIKKIRKLGAKVAIDDFGAGYSNLYEISSINFDIIKVDGSIIRNLPNSECNRKLLDVITHMGLLFDARIVAEFVEDQPIQDIIEQTGIDYSQGYFFAKPLPFEELDLL